MHSAALPAPAIEIVERIKDKKGKSKKGDKIDESLESAFFFFFFLQAEDLEKYFVFAKKTSIFEAKVTSGSISHPKMSLHIVFYSHPAPAISVPPGEGEQPCLKGWCPPMQQQQGDACREPSSYHLHPAPAGTH